MALKLTVKAFETLKQSVSDLKDQKVIFIDAGSVATGFTNLIVDMAVSRGGVTREQAYKNIHMFNAKGLVLKDRKDLFAYNKTFMHENVPGVKTPLDGVKAFKTTTIIGVSVCSGLITKAQISHAASHFPI